MAFEEKTKANIYDIRNRLEDELIRQNIKDVSEDDLNLLTENYCYLHGLRHNNKIYNVLIVAYIAGRNSREKNC